MKIKNALLVLLMLTFVVSCNNDDDNYTIGGGDNGDGSGNDDNDNPSSVIGHFPLEVGNTWTYENELTGEANDEQIENSATETLTVSQLDTNTNEAHFTSEVDGDVQGLFTGALANGSITQDGEQFLYSGELSLMEVEGLPEISIPLTDIPVYDGNASAGEELYSTDGEFSMEIPFGGLGTYPIEISYTLSTKQAADYDSMMDYEDVKSSQLLVSNVSIIVQNIPVIGQIELMESTENEALTSTNYFAKEVGLIKSENTIALSFIDLQNLMPIPMDGIPELGAINTYLEQTLVDYEINN